MTAVDDVNAIIQAAPDGELNLPEYTGAPGDLNYLRSYVLDAVTALYGVDESVFDQATLLSTSILRDFLHRAIYDHPSLVAYSQMFANDPYWFERDVGGLFRLEGFALCGEIAWQLQNIYQAFGFESSLFWTFNGEDGTGTPYSYSDGHVRVEVRLEDLDKFIVQDPTYNFLMTDAGDTPLSFREAQFLNLTMPANLQFVDTGIVTYRGTLGIDGMPPGLFDYYRAHYMNVLVAWMEGGVYTIEHREPYLDWYYAHTAVFPGAFGSAVEARDAVLSLRAGGASLLGITDALRSDHQVTGFRLLSLDGLNVVGDFVTLQLSDASYVSINIDTGQVLNGSYDQIVDDITGAGRNLNPDLSIEDFLGPTVFVRYDGKLITPWDVDESSPWIAPLLAEEVSRSPEVHLLNGTTLQTVYDTAGQPWSEKTNYFDANDKLYFGTISYDNGDFSHITYDFQNVQFWSVNEFRWSSTGQLASVRYNYDVGGWLDAFYDYNQDYAWSENQLRYDSAGRLDAALLKYDNGGYLSTVFDVAGLAGWSEWQSRYNPAGQLEAELFRYDNGGSLLVTHDVQNVALWKNMQLRYDASGNLDASLFRYDNGGYLSVVYDVKHTSVWSEWQSRYNSVGQLDAELILYDRGGQLLVNHDVLNVAVWKNMQWRYDASGYIEASLCRYDNGGYLSTVYDVRNNAAWSEWQSRYNPAGQLDAELIRNDDGGVTFVGYDPWNQQPWHHYTDVYDPGGTLVAHKVIMDDFAIV
ncbi:MAG TPA: hypothetical protein VFQ27_04320 [Xanthobacteraceae bacterium]|nr:hypothetical protein [Xanthobacteraceae bacterium]